MNILNKQIDSIYDRQKNLYSKYPHYSQQNAESKKVCEQEKITATSGKDVLGITKGDKENSYIVHFSDSAMVSRAVARGYVTVNGKEVELTEDTKQQLLKTDNNYYYNKDGVPFLSKEQADRCINGKDWKKIVSVSDKVKSDLEKVVKQDFISSNGAYIPEESKRHDVIKQYLNTIPSEQRNSASWTLSRMAGDYASRMETLVKKNNPGWKPGDAFDTSILDQMDDTLGGLDFKV